jgi:probable HAF family extracellular repeat protein
MTGLGALPGGAFFDSLGRGVSGDGSVVVGESTSSNSGNEAFRWQENNDPPMIGLGDLPGGNYASFARAASYDGAVIVGFSESALGTEAFRWTAVDGMVGLGDLPGGTFGSTANDVSWDGVTIVGVGDSADGGRAFLWRQNNDPKMISLGILPGAVNSYATAVSGDGSVVVGSSLTAAGTEAFRWTQPTGMVGLGELPGGGYSSIAWDVSANGSIVVGESISGPSTEAFIWDPANGICSLKQVLVNEYGLDLTGWHLTAATGVSADGRTIVGWGGNPNGFVEGWIAHLGTPVIPTTSRLGLLLMGLLTVTAGVMVWSRRRKAISYGG